MIQRFNCPHSRVLLFQWRRPGPLATTIFVFNFLFLALGTYTPEGIKRIIITITMTIIIITITITIIIIIQRQCLWCCHHDHGHCASSPGSFDECRLSNGWPPTLRPSQPTWAMSLPNLSILWGQIIHLHLLNLCILLQHVKTSHILFNIILSGLHLAFLLSLSLCCHHCTIFHVQHDQTIWVYLWQMPN